MSKVKIIPVAVIGNKAYKTAKKAAEAYAYMVYRNANKRQTKKIGHAAYHHVKWMSWHFQNTTTVRQGPLEFIDGLNYTEAKAYRRSLKIFQKVLP